MAGAVSVSIQILVSGTTDRAMNRTLRILGTGASFLLFGLSSAVLGMLLYPLLLLLPGGRVQRELRMQRLIHHGFRAFVGFMKAVGVIRVSTEGAEALHAPGAVLVVANHPTLIDFVLLGSLMPQLDCVAKQAIWSNPFMRGVVRGAGYVPNDDGDSTVAACAERLRAGRNILLFPEGTRSPGDGSLGPFHRGAAHVAIAAGHPLLPVTIRCVPRGLMRGQKWYDVPERRMHFTLSVAEPIAVPEADAPRGSGARRLTAGLREHFEKRLALA